MYTKYMNKPEVLRFKTKLFKLDAKIVLEIPLLLSAKLHGMERVEGTINGQRFRAGIMLQNDGSYIMSTNAAMLRGATATSGDEVNMVILGPEPEPLPPNDLQVEFSQSREAVTNWDALTLLGKRDWIRWIEDTNNPGTRARRIARTVEQLSEGKRRACCVNVYGFMECRIQEDAQTAKK